MSLKYTNRPNVKPKDLTPKKRKKVAMSFEDEIGNAALNNAMDELEKKRGAAVPGSYEYRKLIKQIVSAGGKIKK